MAAVYFGYLWPRLKPKRRLCP